jgi:FtsP/CotA-like multicopper oxidase with cupredoxin domain
MMKKSTSVIGIDQPLNGFVRRLWPVSVAVCLLILVGLRGEGTPAAARVSDSPPARTLTAPPTLPDQSSEPGTVEVTLTAEPSRYTLLPGRVNNLYTYNGSIPGPTLELREGDRVIVHFQNKLPEPTTVHWHGLHVPVEADGNPMDPVAPGASYTYEFTVPPGTAGTYWYHPHAHGKAGQQVARGLYGAILVRPREEPLPVEVTEKLLLLSDVRVNSRGSLIIPTSNSDELGWEGNLFLVNGQIRPTVEIRSGEVQRWRIVNGSVARYYRLSLAGHRLLHVGSDGGLFEQPVERDEILLSPSERVELLVQGNAAPGSRAVLQSLPYDRYPQGQKPSGWDRPLDLLDLQYSGEPAVAPTALPAVLRPVPALQAESATATRTLVFEYALINHRFFSPDRVDISAPLNATEIWEIENRDDMDHPFHLHGFSFQVLDRNGVPEPFRAWDDTINVPRRERLRIIVRYSSYPGKRMFHCHIMDHEDYGMMGILEVK